MTPRENPFRVDRVTALPFVGGDVAALTNDFLKLGRAAIVGPHGAGKSTLMRAIGEALTGRGVGVLSVGLPGSATKAERRAAIERLADSGDGVVLFDGFEQFDWRERRRVTKTPRLLVTAHRPIRLPTLVTLRPTVETLDRVLGQLEHFQDLCSE